MRVLIVGSGGREHALAWRVSRSESCTALFCVPGNAGISTVARCVKGNPSDPVAMADLASELRIDLTVVGPEAPLVAGIADYFGRRGLRVVGPSREAARLEGSKVFAREFMARHSIPTARYVVCDSPGAALESVKRGFTFPLVIKADGLAAGKGVRIPANAEELETAIDDFMVRRIFGDAGSRVLIEECLTGRESSFMVLSDGRDYKPVAPAQDYKRLEDGDSGPNTGGMGSFSSPGLLDDSTVKFIATRIVEPTLEGMSSEGCTFRGVLYAGLMLTSEGPKVLEYNVRLGDPETQAILVRLDSDPVEALDSIAGGRLHATTVDWSADSSVCVVAASRGYPGDYESGKLISGIEQANDLDGVVVFHAGTALDERERFVTSGGRVLGITARGSTLLEARRRAYEAADLIRFDGMHFRKDIAAGP